MTFAIRDYTEDDCDAVVELVRNLQVHEEQFFDRLKPASEITAWYVRQLSDACASQGGALLVAEEEGEIVGYAAVSTSELSDETLDEVHYTYASVLDLAVAQSVRRQGVGTKLLEACEEVARKAGVQWIRVSALAENGDAVATYENFGFKPLLTTMEKRLGQS